MPRADTNNPPEGYQPALYWVGRKKPSSSNPFVSIGRHYGRTICAMSNVSQLLIQEGNYDETHSTAEQRRQHVVYESLMELSPAIRDIVESNDLVAITALATQIEKGANSARSDDTKALKSAVIDFIGPVDPPISHSEKRGRGFDHDAIGRLLCPCSMDWDDAVTRQQLKDRQIVVTGNDWPLFLWKDQRVDPDDLWSGLLRNKILIKAYQWIFTSPSSVGKEIKATRMCNARLHGMTRVTAASIAYIATQVRFSLSSAGVFSRTDTVTASESFYNSLLVDLLNDSDNQSRVSDLLLFWNQLIFPAFTASITPMAENTALFKIRAQREALRAKELQTQRP